MPESLSFWTQLELGLIRLMTIVLGGMDNLFNVRWGERILSRMVNRWQIRLSHLDDAMVALERERNRIQQQTEDLAIHTAALYLGGRSLVHPELVFDPADPRDDELLDASIEILVKKHLAAVETQEVEEGHYIYRLEPDWAAIRGYLARAAAAADPDVASWLGEGLTFIDDAVLSERDD
jgi:hypothetical protein